jgi:hypothetical protein
MGHLLSTILAASLTSLFTTVAVNFPPKFNVAPGCKAAAAINQAMELSVAQNYQSCMDDEESARQQLHQNWSSFTPQDQARCVSQTQMNGMPSYAEVLGCLLVIAKSPSQPTEKKSRPEAKPDTRTSEKTNEKPNDFSSTIEALRAEVASSATRISKLDNENAELKETVGTLKTTLATSTETITQLQSKIREADRALKTMEQEKLSAENQLHDLADTRATTKAGQDDVSRYWKGVAYVAIGGFIALLVLNALYFGIPWKKAKRMAGPAARLELQSYGLNAQAKMGSVDTTIKPDYQPLRVQQGQAQAIVESVSV